VEANKKKVGLLLLKKKKTQFGEEGFFIKKDAQKVKQIDFFF
jgi:hypothetical protein